MMLLFKNIVRSERLLRRIDDVYLVDSSGNIMFSETKEIGIDFFPPTEEEFGKALEGLPVIISSSTGEKTSVMIKLTSLIDTYLYISRDIEPKIIKYVDETEEAVSFYYSVENSQTGIKITFAILLLLLRFH